MLEDILPSNVELEEENDGSEIYPNGKCPICGEGNPCSCVRSEPDDTE